MTISLGEAQRLHVKLTSKLLTWGYAQGYEFTWGETLRSQAQALANAKSGAGIAHSLHLIKLAVDLNAFKDGLFLKNIEDYRPLGNYWKSLHELACWGGDFHSPDADHFSITFNGIK